MSSTFPSEGPARAPRTSATSSPTGGASSEIVARDFTLLAADGFPLAATIYGRAPAPPDDPLVIVNTATGVPRRFYARFAAGLARAGHTVLTYDYRGIGGSRPRSLRGFRACMSDWGQNDFEGALRYAEEGLGQARVHVVGHSVGGQLLGFAPSNRRIDRAFCVGAQLGDYRLWPARQRPRLMAMWYGVMPIANALFGYVPGVLGIGEDLPHGVADEWRRWCITEGYFFGGDGACRHEGFARMSASILALSTEADPFAPVSAVDAWAATFSNSHVTREHVEDERLGHFGFFRETSAGLWSRVADFFAG